MMYHLLVFAYLYFIQGLPYGLQSKFLPVYFRTHGMSLTDISFFKMLLIPWMCKALWAPFVDRYKTKKSWLQYSMLGLVMTCFMGSFTSPTSIPSLAFVFLMFNLITSIQDIAVDGIAIEILSSSDLGYANIAQVVGYKLGAVLSGGMLVWLSDYVNWTFLFLCLTGVYCLSVLLVSGILEDTSQTKHTEDQPISLNRPPLHPDMEHATLKTGGCQQGSEGHTGMIKWWFVHLLDVFRSPGTKWTMVFVLLYKLGECTVMAHLFCFEFKTKSFPQRIVETHNLFIVLEYQDFVL